MKELSLVELSSFDGETEDVNVIVETPRGNRNTFDFDGEHKLFKLAKVLPEGMVFPFRLCPINSRRGWRPLRYTPPHGRADDYGLSGHWPRGGRDRSLAN